MQHFSQLPARFHGICHDRPVKQRQLLSRRRESVSERTNLFPKKKPPYPIESDKAVSARRELVGRLLFINLDCCLSFFLQAGQAFFYPRLPNASALFLSSTARPNFYSQLSAPPVWYSMTRVSKKLRSFFRSIISLIQGKGFSSCSNIGSKPICCARRLAMNLR